MKVAIESGDVLEVAVSEGDRIIGVLKVELVLGQVSAARAKAPRAAVQRVVAESAADEAARGGRRRRRRASPEARARMAEAQKRRRERERTGGRR